MEVSPMSRHQVASRLVPILAVGALTAAIGASCSAGGAATQGTGGSATGSNTTGSASGGAHSTSGTGADDIGFDGGTTTNASSGGVDLDGGCAGEATKAKLLPLDIYIMLDQSGSMLGTIGGGTQTKWQAVTGALQDFLTQPGLFASSVSVGIQYFGLPPSATPSCPTTCSGDADCGNYGPCSSGACVTCGFAAPDSCNPADYAKAEVEIAPLNNPQIINLLTSIQNRVPYTNTPTQPALQGALDHAKVWATNNPDHVVVALFATDGKPTECTVQSASGLAQISAAAFGGTPSVRTFSIGVFEAADKPEGPNVLNAVAAAGGSDKAFIIDATNPNLQAEFLKALNSIRGSALGCQYKIPQTDAGMADYNKVNVEYTPGGGGAAEDFPKYNDAASCPATGNGWYYDDNTHPTQILLCPKTCDKVSKDTMGGVNIVLGCQTKLPT
ncbi:Hypothetical protein A7982_02466 [Minicystis rosea]|nr:Hypothetical protein A7982_02466 [Minicystis rosea]